MYMIKDLINKALDGDKKAESEIFARLTVRFKYFAKRYIAEEDAEDIAQEACVTIIEKYKTETFERGFESWAYGVLKKKLGNHFQRKATEKKNIVKGDIDNRPAISTEDSNPGLKVQLIKCLKKINSINPRYARALNLVHLGYDTDEICRMLEIKPNYLYVLLNRGRNMLRSCLNSNEVQDE